MPVREMERSGEPPAVLVCAPWQCWEKTCHAGQGAWEHSPGSAMLRLLVPGDNSPVALSAEGMLSQREQNPASFCLLVFSAFWDSVAAGVD